MHVVGARPNFVKAAPVVAALGERGVPQLLVHTGQHYDQAMSEVFFTQLELPRPDVALGVGSGGHAEQTAALLQGMERTILEHRPTMVVVYGDVNSTLAAALAAAKLGVPVAHVEAGLRSFDDTMPEEINRRLTDQLAAVCLCTSPEAVGNLAREGIAVERAHLVGNPMIDTLTAHLPRLDPEPVRRTLGVGERYLVATLHRPANVDDPERVRRLVARLHEAATQLPLVIPLHPRGRERLQAAGLSDHPGVFVADPLGYHDFLALVRGAAAMVTDSGGVQEETTMLGVPCLTLRPNTERPITISHGTNQLVHEDELVERLGKVLADDGDIPGDPPPLWDGQAGRRIAGVLAEWC